MQPNSFSAIVEIAPKEPNEKINSNEIVPIDSMLTQFFNELITHDLILDFIIIPMSDNKRLGFLRSSEKYPQICMEIEEVKKDTAYFIERIQDNTGLVVAISFKRQSFVTLFQRIGWELCSIPQIEAKALINHFFSKDLLLLASRLKGGNLFFIPKGAKSIYLVNGESLNGLLTI